MDSSINGRKTTNYVYVTMTTWNDTTTSSTAWDPGDGINQDVSIIYNAPLLYDVDYITYDGYYIEENTDWGDQSTVETAWRDES